MSGKGGVLTRGLQIWLYTHTHIHPENIAALIRKRNHKLYNLLLLVSPGCALEGLMMKGLYHKY
jgi:hypothetical protein